MGPELWLSLGLGVATSLLLGGIYVGWKIQSYRVAWLEDEQAELLDQLAAALEDQERGRDAAEAMVRVARSAALSRLDRRVRSAAERRRLLLEGASDEPNESALAGGASA